MNTSSILVTGGEGMVGSQVDFGIRLGRDSLDVTNRKSIASILDTVRPKTILHMAVLLDMNVCEKNPDEAQKINVQGTMNVFSECVKRNIKFVYISSCAVFNGLKLTPYDENDKPKPISAYGSTKLDGEAIVLHAKNSLVIRTGWLFGGGQKDKRFVKFSYDQLACGKKLRATDDRFGSPTYIPDFLKTINGLLKTQSSGIYHVVNSGVASYYEIAQEIKKITKFSTVVEPVHAREIENNSLVRRGKMEALTSVKILPLRLWKTALSEYIIKLQNS